MSYDSDVSSDIEDNQGLPKAPEPIPEPAASQTRRPVGGKKLFSKPIDQTEINAQRGNMRHTDTQQNFQPEIFSSLNALNSFRTGGPQPDAPRANFEPHLYPHQPHQPQPNAQRKPNDFQAPRDPAQHFPQTRHPSHPTQHFSHPQHPSEFRPTEPVEPYPQAPYRPGTYAVAVQYDSEDEDENNQYNHNNQFHHGHHPSYGYQHHLTPAPAPAANSNSNQPAYADEFNFLRLPQFIGVFPVQYSVVDIAKLTDKELSAYGMRPGHISVFRQKHGHLKPDPPVEIVKAVPEVLDEMGLSRFVAVFENEGLRPQDLKTLTEANLISLGLGIGHRNAYRERFPNPQSGVIGNTTTTTEMINTTPEMINTTTEMGNTTEMTFEHAQNKELYEFLKKIEMEQFYPQISDDGFSVDVLHNINNPASYSKYGFQSGHINTWESVFQNGVSAVTPNTVEQELQELGLSRFLNKFRQAGWKKVSEFPKITEENLKKMGMGTGFIAKFDKKYNIITKN